MTTFHDRSWSVSVGEKSWAAREWPEWCHEHNIKFEWDWTQNQKDRITMFNMYFESEEDYIHFKLVWQ